MVTAIEPNPARRLAELLTLGRSVDRDTPGQTALWVWQEVFDQTPPDVFRSIAGFYSLAENARLAVLERDPETFEWVGSQMSAIESAQGFHLNAPWSGYFEMMGGDTCINLLQLTASILDKSDDYGLRITNVEDLRQHLEQLASDVENSDLPPGVKRVSLRYLRRLLRFLAKQGYTTTEELVEVVEAAQVYLLGDREIVETLKRSKTGTAVLATLFALKAFTTLGIGTAPTEIPPAPEVVVNVESKCYAPPELLPGDPATRELGPVVDEP
jgi:hypothetical protein